MCARPRPNQVFQTVEELMVVINDYQEASGNSLAIRRSRDSSRAMRLFIPGRFWPKGTAGRYHPQAGKLLPAA
ncbi:hypothetical protein IV203_008570 [Nitzschia inconspicua]|uniref:Uncharacterized protein n=1 Tax=Nitzschia inconspicua TaxID=303405 RepID=A0A9K3KZK8_9STRA|nr:hypothetical protein IV203_008570 [Nitzschia inconspicua]